MWPGFKSQYRCHMWVEFLVGSLVCYERFFSGYSGFPLSSKTNVWWTKFQFDQESGRRRTTMWMCYLWIIIYIIYKSNHKLTLEMTAFVMGNQVPVRRTERIHFDCWCILYGVLLAFYDGPKEKHLGDNLFTATQTPVTAQFFFSWRTSSFLTSLSQWERVQASHHVMLEVIETRSVASRYHGSKILRSQQYGA